MPRYGQIARKLHGPRVLVHDLETDRTHRADLNALGGAGPVEAGDLVAFETDPHAQSVTRLARIDRLPPDRAATISIPDTPEEQRRRIEARWLADNAAAIAAANAAVEAHPHAYPLIVRGRQGGYRFAGTTVPAAQVIGMLPQADNAELRARWPELSDDHLLIARVLGIAHAVGEGRASGDAGETLAELANLDVTLLRTLEREIAAERALRAELAQAPRDARADLLARAVAEVRHARRLNPMFTDPEETSKPVPGSTPDHASDTSDAAPERAAPSAEAITGSIAERQDERRRVRALDNRALAARWRDLRQQTAETARNGDADQRQRLEARLQAVEQEQARRWRADTL